MKKIFLSSSSKNTSTEVFPKLKSKKIPYYLFSFYYHTPNSVWNDVQQYCDEILVDSGAHTFQIQNSKKNKTVNYDEYLEKYIKFIQDNSSNKKIIGFFELDIDCAVGYEKVKEYRQRLEAVSTKIIPVWHKNRGIPDFIEMCKTRPNKIVAITGFKDEDISDDQYHLFCGVAKKYNCKLHILGMTRNELLSTLDFYSCDSSTYCSPVQWGQKRILSYNNEGVPEIKSVTNKHFKRGKEKDGLLADLETVCLPLVNYYKTH